MKIGILKDAGVEGQRELRCTTERRVRQYSHDKEGRGGDRHPYTQVGALRGPCGLIKT